MLRQNQFGGQNAGHITDVFDSTVAASFLQMANVSQDPSQPFNQFNYISRFVTPPGFDLTPQMKRGDAVVLAWLPNETLAPSLNQFAPRYSRKDTQNAAAI